MVHGQVGGKSQFLAPYAHCAAHCANLNTYRARIVSVFMQNSLNCDHDLGVLFGQLGKLREVFK